ncbi:MAG TPA: hypothetical protein VG894_08850 [Bauldia sp.]|nr:hypothetical protein [Bauldia sp.]
MSKHLMILAASTAAVLAIAAGSALADGSATGSASSGASASAGASQPSGSTVVIGASGNENATAQPGAGSGASTSGGGSGVAGTFYFVIGSRTPQPAITTDSVNLNDGTIYGEGTFAAAGAGTHGVAWAKGAVAEAGPESGPLATAGGGSATLYCKLTIKNWAQWWGYSRDVRKVVQRCECPTVPKVMKLNKACPAKPTEVFAAVVQ